MECGEISHGSFFRALVSLFLAWTATACIVPPSPLPPELSEDPAPRERPRIERLSTHAIPVRIAACEGAARINVTNTARGNLELSALASRVRGSDGTLEASCVLEPDATAGPLLLDGKPFAGRLVVRARAGGLSVVNQVELEDYVRGVVAGETVLWSATPSELEAQAIAARSYAVATLLERAADVAPFLWDDTRDQVYVGDWSGRDSAGLRKVEARLDAAMVATRGRVLGAGGRVLDCRFHASCGGQTAAFRDIFGIESTASALPSVQCYPCRGRAASERTEREPKRDVTWSFTAGTTELTTIARQLGLGTRLTSITPVERDPHGRWLSVELTGDRATQRVSFEELRRVLGPARLKSAFVARTWPGAGDPITGGLLFEGVGRGHGVGLCQIGARDMATSGWTASRILAHYYPGARIGRVAEDGRFVGSSLLRGRE